MDKYEYRIRAEEINSLIERKEYVEAVKIADTIDWRRVRSVVMLCKVSELYKMNRRYEDSKEVLLLAYDLQPNSRKIIYSLCELSIKLEETVQAVEYYKEFTQIAPRDTGRFILQYRLYEAQDVSLEERIAVLEEYKKRDYREKWAYELAYLYHRIGLATRCVEECDEIILWFGEGRYVIKALELKMLHAPLTPSQQEKYNARFMVPVEEAVAAESVNVVQTEENVEPSLPIDIKSIDPTRAKTAEIPSKQVSVEAENIAHILQGVISTQEVEMQEIPGGTVEIPQEEVSADEYPPEEMISREAVSVEEYPLEELDEEVVSLESASEDNMSEESVSLETPEDEDADMKIVNPAEDLDIQVKTIDVGDAYNTINLQEELAKNLAEILAQEDMEALDATKALPVDSIFQATSQGISLAKTKEVPEVEEVREEVSEEPEVEKSAADVKEVMEIFVPETEEESVEPVKAVEEVKAQESVEAVEEVKAQEPVEAVEEVKAQEPVEAVEEVKAEEPVEAVEEVKAQESVEAVEEVEEVKAEEPVEAVEEVKAEEPVEAVEEVKAEEPVKAVEEVKAQEPVEAIEEVKAEEPVEAVEEVKAQEEEPISVEDGESKEIEETEELEEIEEIQKMEEPAEELAELKETEPSEIEVPRAEKPAVAMGIEPLLFGKNEPLPEAFIQAVQSVAMEAAKEAAKQAAHATVEAMKEMQPEITASKKDEDSVIEDSQDKDEETVISPEKEQDSEEEKQITGQLSFTDIMAEWEETKKANEEKHLQEMKQRVKEQTGPLFSDFDSTTKAESSLDMLSPMLDVFSDTEGLATEVENALIEDIPEEVSVVPETLVEEEMPVESGILAEEETAVIYDTPVVEEAPAITEPSTVAETTTVDTVTITEDTLEDRPSSFNTEEINGLADKLMDALGNQHYETSNISVQIPIEPVVKEEILPRGLTKEEKELFGSIAQTKEIQEKVAYALDSISLAPASGNVIVTGEKGTGALEVAQNIAAYLSKTKPGFTGNSVTYTGKELTETSIISVINEVVNGALIVENAGDMSANLCGKLLKAGNDLIGKGIVFIFVDTKSDMERLIRAYQKLTEFFDVSIDITTLDNNGLVNFGKVYAREKEYSIDDMGVLALYNRIEERQTNEHAVTVDEVKEIVNEAIVKAEKKNLTHFMDIVFAKRYDKDDMVVLREKDFMIE